MDAVLTGGYTPEPRRPTKQKRDRYAIARSSTHGTLLLASTRTKHLDALHPGSDLDVFVVQEEAGPWIDPWRADVEEAIEIPVNVLTFTPEEWRATESNDERIVTEIQSGAIMLHGSLP